jgi:hypothetical protein
MLGKGKKIFGVGQQEHEEGLSAAKRKDGLAPFEMKKKWVCRDGDGR